MAHLALSSASSGHGFLLEAIAGYNGDDSDGWPLTLYRVGQIGWIFRAGAETTVPVSAGGILGHDRHIPLNSKGGWQGATRIRSTMMMSMRRG